MMLFTVAVFACVPHVVWSIQDVCSGTGVRPVLLIPGFQGAPLYDKERNYDIEWPDVDTFGKQFTFDPEPAAIDLPLEWDGLQQAAHRIGPERRKDDEYPGLDGPFGDIFEFAVRSCSMFFSMCGYQLSASHNCAVGPSCDCPSPIESPRQRAYLLLSRTNIFAVVTPSAGLAYNMQS